MYSRETILTNLEFKLLLFDSVTKGKLQKLEIILILEMISFWEPDILNQ